MNSLGSHSLLAHLFLNQSTHYDSSSCQAQVQEETSTTMFRMIKAFLDMQLPVVDISASDVAIALAIVYIAIEIVFYFVFHFHMVPKANKWVAPQDFRGVYHRQRNLVVLRLMERVQQTSSYFQEPIEQLAARFLLDWLVDHGSDEEEQKTPVTPKVSDKVSKRPILSNSSIILKKKIGSSTPPRCPPNKDSCSDKTVKKTRSLSIASSASHSSNATLKKFNTSTNSRPPPLTRVSAYSSPSESDRSLVPEFEGEGGEETTVESFSASESSAQEECDSEQDDDYFSTTSTEAHQSSKAQDEPLIDIMYLDNGKWTFPEVGKDVVDDFLIWALFGKCNLNQKLEAWEENEVKLCYKHFEEHFGLIFLPIESSEEQANSSPTIEVDTLVDTKNKTGKGPEKLTKNIRRGRYSAKRLSLEDVNPLHRPLAIYMFVALLKFFVGCVLRLVGFSRRVDEATGLTGWYRPAKESSSHMLPLLFFHGIAPAPMVFYTPMVLLGLASDGRAVFFFENSSISCALGFKALTEQATVQGVETIVNSCVGTTRDVSLCGHSFGSVPMTWLLHSDSFSSRIRQFVLLDPVTVLLSEPDVMTNFLYNKNQSCHIRAAASSELFTEYYLRRHFSWYNSELWMDDLVNASSRSDSEDEATRRQRIKAIFCLSEQDEIVNGPKVHRTIQMQMQLLQGKDTKDKDAPPRPGAPNTSDDMRAILWKGAAHADCVMQPRKWREIKAHMNEQEQHIHENGCITV